jgi:hypothetical protein
MPEVDIEEFDDPDPNVIREEAQTSSTHCTRQVDSSSD